ncbi:MAG TPA: hypothetical protein VIH59_17245 [Candidatus Tectomicrobia bacterium]|jgi:hypothetical protein
MQQRFLVLMLVVGLACTQGCATYRVTIPDSHPVDINYRGKTMHAFFWGISYDPEVWAADCGREAINDVQIKRNLLYDLVSVLTLGIWMPIEVNFRCASARIREGEPIRPR